MRLRCRYQYPRSLEGIQKNVGNANIEVRGGTSIDLDVGGKGISQRRGIIGVELGMSAATKGCKWGSQAGLPQFSSQGRGDGGGAICIEFGALAV